jgi:hypothetical protein
MVPVLALVMVLASEAQLVPEPDWVTVLELVRVAQLPLWR